jgi:hypothetical protein
LERRFDQRAKGTVRVMRGLVALWMVGLVVGIGMARGAEPSGAGLDIPWDLSGVIGTGQSLSVGARASRVPATQVAGGNLQLSTDHLAWPIDANNPQLALVPLKEPIGRRAPSYPSSFPENIDGETLHGAMATELSALVRAAGGRDFVSVQGALGENGQGMVFLKKNAVPRGVNGRSFAAAMMWTRAVDRLAKASNRTFGVGAVVVTHGEADAGNTRYEEELHQLWEDYNHDVKAITGQSQNVQMIVSQQNSVWPISTVAQWKIGVDYPETIVCSGPKYQYPYADDSVHLVNVGYEQLGEKYAQVYFERVIRGQRWEPLQPIKAERWGTLIRLTYHVPVGPMVWDATMGMPHAQSAEWKAGRGFEVTAADGRKVGISSVGIEGDAVLVNCAADPGAGARVSYATAEDKAAMQSPFLGTKRWGLLRDSDPFTGVVTGKAQPNYGVVFEMPVR